MTKHEKQKRLPSDVRHAHQGAIALLIAVGLLIFLAVYAQALFQLPTFSVSTPYLPVVLVYDPTARLIIIVIVLILELLLLLFTIRRRLVMARAGTVLLLVIAGGLAVLNGFAYNAMHLNLYNEVVTHGHAYKLVGTWQIINDEGRYILLKCDPAGTTCFYFDETHIERPDVLPIPMIPPAELILDQAGGLSVQSGDWLYPMLSTHVGN